ncbi:MAG TPA: DUF932 domain-containing protein [Bacteroidetes bacterium]|nr:hypothetical protein BMS3Bbin04_00379 [bacterium BMS3Bbin04]HDO65827.1 DUF932 domain-containing protein [Bacteroidota bacterium]HEX04952.1 DUF932 domain-containing protein [Bacteroidota bacterium]
MIKSKPPPSPYVPVELQPLQTVNGKASSRQAVILDPQGEATEVGIVSPEYKLVKNSEVVQVAEDLLNSTGMPVENHQTLFNGKKFRQRYLLSQTTGEVKVGDVVAVTLDAVNGYDGSTTFGLEFNAIRLVCSNGMMLSFMLGGFRFKHWGSQNFDREMRVAARQLTRVGDRLHMVLPMLTELTHKRMKRADIQRFFAETNLPITTQAKVFNAIEDDTRWGVYNDATSILTDQKRFSAETLNRRVSQYFLLPN